MKKITLLCNISLIFLSVMSSGNEKSDSLFMLYKVIYPELKAITDSLLSECPGNCIYVMDISTGSSSEMTQILFQRCDIDNPVFCSQDSYGVITDGHRYIYLMNDRESDLVSETGEFVKAPSVKIIDFETLNDKEFQMFLFDKTRLYKITRDMKLEPVSSVRPHIIDRSPKR